MTAGVACFKGHNLRYPALFCAAISQLRGVVHCGRQNVVLHAKMRVDPIRATSGSTFDRSVASYANEHYSSASPDS